jgi:hypothetical protein
MKNYGLVAAAASLMAFSTPVSAVPLIIFAPNSNAMPGYVNGPAVFENFTPDNAFTPGQTANGMPFTNATGVNGSSNGNVRIYSQNVSGQAVGPVPAQGAFLSILNGSYTATLGGATGVQVFSFLLGGLDGYNSVRLNYANGGFDVLNGLAIIGLAPANTTPLNNSNTGQTGRVTYDRQGQSGIVSVVFSSAQAAFELDEIQSAAPEPSTWGMMIFGFGIAGAALRSRRRRTGLATV